jgi:regulation of enolase protein 1 (concanavalin A-like superfamily)
MQVLKRERLYRAYWDNDMRKQLLSIICIISILFLSSVLSFTLNIQTVKAQQSLSDDFTTSTLNSNWVFTDPSGGSTVDLTVNSGYLRIITTAPPARDLYNPVNTNAPRLTTSTSGDFVAETKITATTDQEWESAGILVWKDSTNFLRLDRACGASNSQRIVFIMCKAGGWDPVDVVLPSNINPTFLKLGRSGNVFTGYYSTDGSQWTLVGEKTLPSSDPINVGIDVVNVYHDGTFFADFDYFYLTPVPLPTPTPTQSSKPVPILDISSKSSTSYSGFNVEIKGKLSFNEEALANAPVLISYSVNGGKTWQDLTLVNTASDGTYSASWKPSVTGNYLIKATYEADENYSETNQIVNLAVTQYAEKNAFSVSSNSTVSSLAFNSTSRELSFTVTGPSGTTGYADVFIAKSLIQDASSITVSLDENSVDYTATSTGDSWILHFTYSHSTHEVRVNLANSTLIGGTQLRNWVIYLVIAIVVIAIAGIIIVLKIKERK